MAGTQASSHEDMIRLALRHLRSGRLEDSEAILRNILEASPQHPQALHFLGIIFRHKGDHDTAIDLIRRSIALSPRVASYHYNLGLVLVEQDELTKAVEAFRKTVELNPRYADALNNIGTAYHKMGSVHESVRYHREALRLKPDDAHMHSNLLFTLSYHALLTPEETLNAHLAWDRAHGAEGRNHAFSHAPDRDAEKRLKIGYVSPDLRRHAVASFFEPLIAAHDRSLVEVYCYAEVHQEDAVTARIRKHSDHWRSTVGHSDRAVAGQIYEDGIDILVDLAGHTDHNRLKVFTHKPAPVQAAYLGYCATTGLSAIDYWITDHLLHPVGTEEKTVEVIYRLPRCWLCYGPDRDAPPVTRKVDPSQSVTFGSFNHISKITPEVASIWAGILKSVPDSRLILKSNQLHNTEVRRAIRTRFEKLGIGEERLELLPPSREYLAAYNRIDIALDPFPRSGGATTADALWMGVPVITLAGARFIERQGVSMLTAVGLEDLIANDTAEYVDKAVLLATDHDRLGTIRETLRHTMAGSPLCDGRGLAEALETAFCDMWRRHSAGEARPD